jgi:hypothetical protein
MPEDWYEIERDEQSPTPSLACTNDLVGRVARVADTIAVVRVGSPELDRPYPTGPFRMHDVSILRLVKGPDDLRRRSVAWVELDDPEIATVADDGTKLRTGEQYIFLLQDHTVRLEKVALYPCGILMMNHANLEMVQEVVAKSIE